MAERLKQAEGSPGNADEARRQAAEDQRHAPTETKTHGMEREPEGTSPSEDIHAHTNRPHKGDVGRPGTNEEVFQGSKQRELK
jgi:hypothetical protein